MAYLWICIQAWSTLHMYMYSHTWHVYVYVFSRCETHDRRAITVHSIISTYPLPCPTGSPLQSKDNDLTRWFTALFYERLCWRLYRNARLFFRIDLNIQGFVLQNQYIYIYIYSICYMTQNQVVFPGYVSQATPYVFVDIVSNEFIFLGVCSQSLTVMSLRYTFETQHVFRGARPGEYYYL